MRKFSPEGGGGKKFRYFCGGNGEGGRGGHDQTPREAKKKSEVTPTLHRKKACLSISFDREEAWRGGEKKMISPVRKKGGLLIEKKGELWRPQHHKKRAGGERRREKHINLSLCGSTWKGTQIDRMPGGGEGKTVFKFGATL